MKNLRRNVWAVLVLVVFVAMASGCATTKSAPGVPTNLTVQESKPVLFMQGEFDGIKIVHRGALYKGEKVTLLDWASVNVLDEGAKKLYFEVGLEIEDEDIVEVYVKRFINKDSSEWATIEPLFQENSFRVKLPSDKGKKEFSLKFRFVRKNGEEQIVETKTLKCNFI